MPSHRLLHHLPISLHALCPIANTMIHPVRAKNTGLAIAATLAATAVAQNGTSGGGSSTIRWGPCPGGAAADPIVCGELPVPLDYTSNRTGETLALQLTKLPATTQPSRGSILLNFGGPGNDGRTMLVQFADFLPLWVFFLPHDAAASSAGRPRGLCIYETDRCIADPEESLISSASTPGTYYSQQFKSGPGPGNYANTMQMHIKRN